VQQELKKNNLFNKRIIITGGGSGGHVSAASGLIDEIVDKYPDAKQNILYVGGKLVSETRKEGKSVEQMRFEKGDIPFVAIRGGKLQRSFSFHSIALIFGVFGGIIDSFKVVGKFKPDFIFSTGGFVSLPVCLVGWLKKIPIYLHEQTAAVGLTNKMVGKVAKKVFVTFPQSIKYFKPGIAIHTGNLIRKSLFISNPKGELSNALKKMLPQKDQLPIVYVSGGGLGSHTINIVVRQMLKYVLGEFQIILQTGDNGLNKDYEVLIKDKATLGELGNRFFVTKYVSNEEIGYLFNNIDIYVGRSGANTVYEMGIFMKPSILIPIPWVTHDEQNKNAQILVDCGIGTILPEGELTAESLFEKMKSMKKCITENSHCANESKIKEIFVTDGTQKVLNAIGL